MDTFVRFYYSAAAHRCTLQAELCCLFDSLGPGTREQPLVYLITLYTFPPPGHSWGLAYAGGEGSAHLRDQSEVLRRLLSSAMLHPQCCMGRASSLQCSGETVTRGLQRRAGQLNTQGSTAEQYTFFLIDHTQLLRHLVGPFQLSILWNSVISVSIVQEENYYKAVIPYFRYLFIYCINVEWLVLCWKYFCSNSKS